MPSLSLLLLYPIVLLSRLVTRASINFRNYKAICVGVNTHIHIHVHSTCISMCWLSVFIIVFSPLEEILIVIVFVFAVCVTCALCLRRE